MTRDEIRDYVLDRLSISSSDTAKVTQVNTVIEQEHLRLSLRHALKRTQTTMSASAATVALPSDCTRILSIANTETTLLPVTPETYLEYLQSDAAAEDALPTYYIRESPGSIRIFPVPDTAVTLTINYVARPTALTTGSSEPTDLPEEFHLLLGELAVAKIALNEEEAGQHQAAMQMASQMEAELAVYMRQLVGTGPRRIWRMGYDY